MLKPMQFLASTALAAIIAAPSAWAGCQGNIGPARHAAWQTPRDGGAAVITEASFSNPSIVGLWSFTFTDQNNNVIDFGYVAWHSDGTEIENSGGRPPATGNFCMGVWQQLSGRHYGLNHYALGYDPTSGVLNAKVRIKENVTVDPTNTSYSGPFDESVFDPTTGKRIAHVTGTVTGQRLTLNSP